MKLVLYLTDYAQVCQATCIRISLSTSTLVLSPYSAVPYTAHRSRILMSSIKSVFETF
jgi:hypothetical protein